MFLRRTDGRTDGRRDGPHAGDREEEGEDCRMNTERRDGREGGSQGLQLQEGACANDVCSEGLAEF